jgi:hypothetical protein
VTIVEAEQLGTEADRKYQNLDPAPARNQEVAELMEEDDKREDEQKGNHEAEDPRTQRIDPGQKIKIHEMDIPGRPRSFPKPES